MTIRTVLYLHGLESGPHGRKARNLASAGFDVVSYQMPCGRAQIARDPAVLGVALSALALVAGGAKAGGVVGLGLAAGAVASAAPWVGARVLRRVVRRSLEVQTGALAARRIDAVVGSSFGGAIALALLQRGAWSGPTVLLCPAYELVARRARWPVPPPLAALPEGVSARVVIVHGLRDQTVPVDHSRVLAAGSGARLVLVDDDHRLSQAATPERLAAWLAAAAG